MKSTRVEIFVTYLIASKTLSFFRIRILQYVDKVRDSAEWGGHLELRALRIALERPILIYSVQNGTEPLEIHNENETPDKTEADKKEPIRLSYHLHYYALGEHYNQVVKLA